MTPAEFQELAWLLFAVVIELACIAGALFLKSFKK